MNDSDSQIINPLSNSNVSQDVQKALIRQGVESDCELECSQNPMLTDEENNEKSFVINKLIENSQQSNGKVKKSGFQTKQNSIQLQSSNCYRIQVSTVQSGKQNEIFNPMYSGDEDQGSQLKEKITILETKITQYYQEFKIIKDELCLTNESLKQLQNENQFILQENQQLKSKIQTQEQQINNIYAFLRENEKETNEKVLYPNKRSKTSTDISKATMLQGQNNSYLTDKSISPLSYQFNDYMINIQKSSQKPIVPHLPIYGQQKLAALLKINTSQSQNKERNRTLSKEPDCYIPQHPHKLSKSNTQHLHQVKGQGMPSTFSFINSILKY